MTDIINPILQWLNANPNLASFATLLIAAAESVAVVGTIVPGTVMMTAIGALAGAGVIPLWPTLFWAAIGAIIGDGISYWLGHHYKERIRQIWPFRKHPEWLVRGEDFCHKYGGMSVFIGRFVGPVRALVPLIAGMLGMRPVRFYIANILSAILWSPIYLLPGILIGAVSLELPHEVAVHVILVLFFSALFFVLCGWLVIKFILTINDQINHWLNRFWNHLQKSRSGHLITYSLRHHDIQKTHGQLVLAFYFLIVTFIFLFLAKYIASHGSSTLYLNQGFYYFFRSLHTPTLDKVMFAITLLGQPTQVCSLIFGVIFLWFLLTKRFYIAFHVLALLLLSIGCLETAKHWVHSARPTMLEKIPTGFSFPSGHTTFATTLYIGMALLFSVQFRKVKRIFLYPALVIAFLVGISRLYLEAHWFTDVIGGWLLGSALLMLVAISFNRKKVSAPNNNTLYIVFFTALIAIYGSYAFYKLEFRGTEYQLKPYSTYSITSQVWWDQKDDQLPRYRLSRFGVATQVLNVQWLGDLKTIQNTLLANGWEIPPERDWINVIMRLSDIQSMQYLPLLSPLYLDQKPVLVMIRRTDPTKNLIVLRLWSSNIKFSDVNNDLWVGTVEPAPRTYHWILRKNQRFAISQEFLLSQMQKQFQTKLIVVPPHKRTKEPQKILLIKPK